MLLFASLQPIVSAALEFPFFEEEVLATLFDLDGDKALGPDGFSLAFWQYSWDIVKLEVMSFFGEFHDLGSFERSLNAMFLVLVPNKERERERGGGGCRRP